MGQVVTITTDDRGAAGDQVRLLYAYLTEEDEFRGRVRLKERPPEPGTLGPVAEALLVLQPPLVALVGALIAWIRTRHSTIDLTITTADGASATISARHICQLRSDELGSVLDELVRAVEVVGEVRSVQEPVGEQSGQPAGS